MSPVSWLLVVLVSATICQLIIDLNKIQEVKRESQKRLESLPLPPKTARGGKPNYRSFDWPRGMGMFIPNPRLGQHEKEILNENLSNMLFLQRQRNKYANKLVHIQRKEDLLPDTRMLFDIQSPSRSKMPPVRYLAG